MKTVYTIILAFLFCWQLNGQRCLPDGITFTSQEQIDNFPIDYPGCSIIEGRLFINENANVKNLDSLYQIEVIEGDFLLRGANEIRNLDALKNMKFEGSVTIEENALLSDISALNGITEIFGNFRISENPRLQSLNGLENLENVSGGLFIGNAESSLQPLSNLKSAGSVFINNSNRLVNLNGLEGLTELGGLSIDGNQRLESLDGLENIEFIEGVFSINRNENLTNISGLENCEFINTSFFIGTIIDNPRLSNCAIKSVCSAFDRGEITINGNNVGCTSSQEVMSACPIGNCPPSGIIIRTQPQIDSFRILYPNCTVIEGDVEIIQLAGITNFDGLSQIDSIKGSFDCRFCDENTLADLENLSYIEKTFRLNLYKDTLVSGPKKLTHIGNSFISEDGYSIRNFGGLSKLETIGGRMFIQNAQLLTGFYGLDNLRYIGELQAEQCFALHSYQGLENLETIGGRLWMLSNDITDLNGLSSLKKVGGDLVIRDQTILTDLSGLENLREVGKLGLYVNKELENIDALKNLQKAQSIEIIQQHKLEVLDFAQVTNLEELFLNLCDNITILDKIPTMVDSAELSIISCDNFNGIIPGSIRLAKNIRISSNDKLQTLGGLEQLEEVTENLSIGSSSLIDNLQTFQNLNSVGSELVIAYLDSLKNLNGLDNLESYGSLKIWSNDNLESIEAIKHSKVEKKSNFIFESTIEITNNPKLAICDYPEICNHLGSPSTERKIQNNATGCATEQEILDECANNFIEIYYQVYFDINQNGIKEIDEPRLPQIPIKLDPIGFTTFSGRDKPGVSFLENKDYELSIDLNYPWTNSTPDTFRFLANQTDTVSFGIYPTENISELIPSIYLSNTRCNEEATLKINLNNFGTTIADGIVSIKIDSLIDSLMFIDLPDVNLNDYLLGWNFETVVPGETLTKTLKFIMPGPPDISPGQIIKLRTFAIYDDILDNHRTPEFEYDSEIACAYDPNDKLVSPSRKIQVFEPPRELDLTLFDEVLTYTVRFQNTGNDVAYDVVIRDTLDENLDVSTFRFLNSSHYEVLDFTIENNRFLTFNFKNIFLPDSTANFEESQGYVSYQINAKEDLFEGTPIRNSASIYFDLNPPIITNTTENIMVSMLPTSSVQNIDNQLDVTLSPNPTTSKIYLKGDNLQKAKITVTDLTGRVLLIEKLNGSNEIELPKSAKGVLFLKIETREGVAVKRVMKF